MSGATVRNLPPHLGSLHVSVHEIFKIVSFAKASQLALPSS